MEAPIPSASVPAIPGESPDRSVTRLVRLLAIGQVALVAATWKLWTPQAVFPQVPLIQAAGDWPDWLDWICLVVLAASSLTMLVGRRGRLSRGAPAASAVSFALFFVLNQHRLQPWAWQFFLLSILLSLADDTTTRRAWIGLTVSIYLWSAVSKVDVVFFESYGPTLIGGLKQAIGLKGVANQWTQSLDIAASIGLTVGELAVAILLAWPRTRWFGLWAATLMHLALLAALGPLGLNHSLGVLLWNVFFIAQDWLLFGIPKVPPATPFPAQPFWPLTWPSRLGLTVIGMAMLWPALEPFGGCDHWLAWAVYSARSDRSQLILGNRWAHIKEESKVLDPSQLSLDRLGVPIYPQHRFQVGVALGLAESRGPRDVTLTLTLWSHSSRWRRRNPQGRREMPGVEFLTGPDELNPWADRYFFNARPRRLTATRLAPDG